MTIDLNDSTLPWRQRKAIQKVFTFITEDNCTVGVPRRNGSWIEIDAINSDGEVETTWQINFTGKVTWNETLA